MPSGRRPPGVSKGLAERLATLVLDGVPRTLPVDLDAAARTLGVAEIREGQLVEDGRTEWVERGPVITVRWDRPRERKRFTLAHELGHVLLTSEVRPAVAMRTRSLELNEEETLCDQIAAALLMPRRWVADLVGQSRLSLTVLREIRARAHVSMAASAVRVTEVRDRRCMLLRWHRTEHRWVPMAKAGIPRDVVGTTRLSPRSEAILDGAPDRRDAWRELTLLADEGVWCRGPAHVSRWGRSAMTLFVDQ